MKKNEIIIDKLLYENNLSCEKDIEGFVLDGKANITFANNKMRIENIAGKCKEQDSNSVLWCPKDFPDNILIEWQFQPIKEPGLCILFFSASGINGEDIFSKKLSERTGEYPQYHHGDINAFHVSYFRRKQEKERRFHTCNLRKSYGFNLVAQGGDPIPNAEDALEVYNISILKKESLIKFYINELEIFKFNDDGTTYGQLLKGGKIGFRQLAPLIAEYSNLKVYSVK